MNYYALTPPVKWQAGTVGQKPFYYGCADCDTETEIAGYLANGERFEDIGITLDGKYPKLALFCAPCLEKRMAATPLAA